MKAVGAVTWIHKESLMDAVTALSGSGPAYVFLFLESLTEAGVEAGLSAEMARMLAIQTVLGSAKLAQEKNIPFNMLREQVTSPGGTTEAALAVLMRDDALKNLLKDAMNKAAERSCELAG
jgi:pyrroline-5-carboxylate reductase